MERVLADLSDFSALLPYCLNSIYDRYSFFFFFNFPVTLSVYSASRLLRTPGELSNNGY
jgi:hypothetical protein